MSDISDVVIVQVQVCARIVLLACVGYNVSVLSTDDHVAVSHLVGAARVICVDGQRGTR